MKKEDNEPTMSYYFPHFSILFVILFAAALYEKRIRYNKIMDIYKETPYFYRSPLTPWLMVFGYLAILAGFRSAMNDTSVYIAEFRSQVVSWEALSQSIKGDIRYSGTAILRILFKMFISENYHAWFLTWAIIESWLLVDVLRRESVSFVDACFFFFASTLYYNYFSMMRQWMAVAILFWGSKYLRDNRMIPYFIVCIVAAVFHTSALIMVPLFFLVNGRAWSGKQLGLITIFVLGMMFLSPILSILETATEGTTYDYAISTMNSNSGSSIIRAFIAAVPVGLAFINRERIEEPMINICVNMSLINFMLNILASATSGLYVIRLATYVAVYNVILYPYLLNYAIEKNRNLIKAGFYVIYLAFLIYQNNYMGAWGYKSDVLTWLSNY